MRLWILFRPFTLAAFLSDTALTGKGGTLPCYCQVEGEVQVAQSASVDSHGGQGPLITAGWGWECQLLIRPLLIPSGWVEQELPIIDSHMALINVMGG